MARFTEIDLQHLPQARKFVEDLADTEWGKEQLAKKIRVLAAGVVCGQRSSISARNADLEKEISYLKAREKQLLVDLADSESREEGFRDENRDLLDRSDVLGLELGYCQKTKSEMALRILQLKAALYDYMQKERSEAGES